MKTALLLLSGLVLLTAVGARAGAEPLFDDEGILVLSIEAPMRDLIRKRLDKPAYDALVTFSDESGTGQVLHGKISARGNARLEACDFPPLRLTLNEDEVAGTMFEGHDRIKMVTQCNKRSNGEKWLLQELGIYRAYNIVTDYSYRTRRLEVTYIDSESSRWARTEAAFFIEPTGKLAARMQRESIRPPAIDNVQHDRLALTRNLLFQLLIANTDFSVKRGTSGEGCCHNGRVLATPGMQHDWIVVPYDFDQAGIINTDYALPDRRLGIRAVNSRLYRGFCWHNKSLPEVIELYRARRAQIEAALIPVEVSKTVKARTARFINGFYAILEDPEELQERITDKCRGGGTFPIRETTTK